MADSNCALPPLGVQYLLQLIGGMLQGATAAVTPDIVLVTNASGATVVGVGARTLSASLSGGSGTVSDGAQTANFSAGEFLNFPIPLGSSLASGLTFTANAGATWTIFLTN